MPIKLNVTEFNKRIGADVVDASGGVLFQAINKIPIPGNRHSIVIGVGGSGSATVEEVKKLVQAKFKDWQNRVAFLAIDADLPELNSRKLLTESEKHGLACDPGANARWHREGERKPEIKKWVNKSFYADVQDSGGAGRIRQAAKARLYDFGVANNPNDNQLLTKIKQVFNNLGVMPGQEVQIYISLGLAGGTGSGLVIDIADLVNRAAPAGVGCRITSFFYLPDTVEQ